MVEIETIEEPEPMAPDEEVKTDALSSKKEETSKTERREQERMEDDPPESSQNSTDGWEQLMGKDLMLKVLCLSRRA